MEHLLTPEVVENTPPGTVVAVATIYGSAELGPWRAAEKAWASFQNASASESCKWPYPTGGDPQLDLKGFDIIIRKICSPSKSTTVPPRYAVGENVELTDRFVFHFNGGVADVDVPLRKRWVVVE